MFSCELRDGLLNVSWRKKETAVIKLRFSLGVRKEYKGNKFPLYPCFASVQQFSIYILLAVQRCGIMRKSHRYYPFNFSHLYVTFITWERHIKAMRMPGTVLLRGP